MGDVLIALCQSLLSICFYLGNGSIVVLMKKRLVYIYILDLIYIHFQFESQYQSGSLIVFVKKLNFANIC